MSLTLILYLTDIFNNLSCAIFILIILYFGILLCTFVAWENSYSADEEAKSRFNKVAKNGWVVIVLIFFCSIIPSKSTMYLMMGSSYLSSSNLPSKVSQALELKLDDVIKDLTKEKSK